MNFKKSLALLVFLSGSGLALAQPQEIVNEVPIVISWSDPIAPSSVSFDTLQSGEQAFQPENKTFKGLRRGNGTWLEHNISVHYPNFSIPLVLRTWHDNERLHLNGSLWRVGCDQSDIDRIKRVDQNSSQREIVGAIIASRYLSKLPASVCPKGVTRKMGQIYFNLSCNFAKQVDFFGLSADARQAYFEFIDNDPDEVSSCAAQSQGIVVKKLYDEQVSAVQAKDWGSAAALYQELDRLDGNVGWAEAFSAQSVTRPLFEANEVIREYSLSLEAGRNQEFAVALEANRKLQDQIAEGNMSGSFQLARVSAMRLKEDEAFFEARLEALEPASQEQSESE